MIQIEKIFLFPSLLNIYTTVCVTLKRLKKYRNTLTNKEKESKNNRKRIENKKTYFRELIAKPPTIRHSCSRHGMVTAELT
jgi:hypothetical protein